MTTRLNPPTLAELKRQGDEAMADAMEAIIKTRQLIEDFQKLRERVEAGSL